MFNYLVFNLYKTYYKYIMRCDKGFDNSIIVIQGRVSLLPQFSDTMHFVQFWINCT